MKKIFLGLILFVCALLSFAPFFRVKAENTKTNEVNQLINEFYDESVTYTKHTQIFFNDAAVEELLVNGGFHADVTTLNRITYYAGDELWMSREDGKYSYYGTAYEGEIPVGVTNAVTNEPLVTPEDVKIVLSGDIEPGDGKKNSMQNYYVGLEDIIAKDEHNWYFENNAYYSTSPEVIEWFKAFTAPCYLGFTTNETADYITLDKVSVSYDENYNLALRLYATSNTGMLTSEGGLFSQATISYRFDDSIWTEEVLSNKLSITHEKVSVDLFATKDDKGIYFKANYVVPELHTTGGWWQQDNLEFRLNSPEGFILNGQTENQNQWLISTSGASNFTQSFVSSASKVEGGYLIVFKMFVTYEKLGVEADTPLGFSFGTNPGGQGFVTGYKWQVEDLSDVKKITTNGILDNCLEGNCSHVFNEFEIVSNPTCKDTGLKSRSCKYCGHVDNEEITATGEHVFILTEVINPSTCSVLGTGVGVCGCGERGTVTLEKYDLTNHADHWNNSNNVCDGCGSVVNNESINISRYNYNYVEFVMDGTQSFEIDVILNTKHNSSSTAWYHSFVGEVFTPGWSEGGWSYRSDWYGNQQFPNAVAKYTDINNGLWGGKYFEASADMDVIINFKFDAETGTFTVTMTYSSNIEPYCNEDKHPIYTLSNVSYRGELHVAFGTENSHTTYQYAKIVEGSGTLLDFDYHNKYLDGNMDEEIWTEEVKANKFEFNKPDGEVLMDIYATRAEDGIYVFVDYKVSELHTSGDWWQQDNLEWRLLTTSGRLYHRFNNNQFYVSTSGNYTSTDFYKSVAVKNGDYFEICFEAFVSYAELGVSADEALAISFAANPGGNGFYAMQPWDTDDFSSALLVTTEGLKQQ